MNKAVFLDRDGTINYDYGYVCEKDRFIIIPGVIEALKKLSELGFLLIIITNQSGIGRGFFSRDAYSMINEYMLDTLKKAGIKITQVYCCPHTDEDGCDCRKPKLGLFYEAIETYAIDLEHSYAIGDHKRDLAICHSSPVKGILLSKDEDVDYVTKSDLLAAARYIEYEIKTQK